MQTFLKFSDIWENATNDLNTKIVQRSNPPYESASSLLNTFFPDTDNPIPSMLRMQSMMKHEMTEVPLCQLGDTLEWKYAQCLCTNVLSRGGETWFWPIPHDILCTASVHNLGSLWFLWSFQRTCSYHYNHGTNSKTKHTHRLLELVQQACWRQKFGWFEEEGRRE